MGWFIPDFWRCDPDRRQNRCSGECTTRDMSPEDWAKYGPKSDAKRKGSYMIGDRDIQRVSKRKRKKKTEGC